MASVMTYQTLTTDIQTYLERTDAPVVNQIPEFIMLAEAAIARQMKTLGQIQVVTFNYTASNAVINKPSWWQKTTSWRTIANGQSTPVLKRTFEYIRNYNASGATGTPKYYCDYDYDHWLVGPVPQSAAYSAEVLYYGHAVPLDATNNTNWFTIHAPDLMLYGTLLQAIPFIKNDVRVPLWQQWYDKAIAEVVGESKSQAADRQTVEQDS